ncbi:hypothetical protein [Streptomyces pseudogriseolus]
MRLDIGVEPSGRLTDLRVRRVDDPALPQAHVGEAQAWETFARHFRISVAVEEREQAVLQAERRGGHWRIHWRLSAREGGMRHSAVVDATDGSIHSANSESVPQTTGPRG